MLTSLSESSVIPHCTVFPRSENGLKKTFLLGPYTLLQEIQSLADPLCIVTVAKLWLENIFFYWRNLVNGQLSVYDPNVAIWYPQCSLTSYRLLQTPSTINCHCTLLCSKAVWCTHMKKYSVVHLHYSLHMHWVTEIKGVFLSMAKFSDCALTLAARCLEPIVESC